MKGRERKKEKDIFDDKALSEMRKESKLHIFI
jgi:hypothetical protein